MKLPPIAPAILLLASAQNAHALHVVLDPGHGGADQGTVHEEGRLRIAEKDITLALAEETARRLTRRGHKVTLTRTIDRDLDLPSRTALANRLKADLFLSIHMNSTGRQDRKHIAQGIETYILNTTTDASSKRIAQLENGVMAGSAKVAEAPSEVSLILKDLTLDANLAESKRIACAIQQSLLKAVNPTEKLPIKDRGVRQALFHVLLGADMPSALIESGFLTHPRDRARILSPGGRKKLAEAIARAVDQYHSQKNTPAALKELSNCQVH